MNTTGSRIRERRKALKLTQVQVAKRVGVSHVSLSQWERGDTEPRGSNLYALCEVLGCDPAWLLSGKNASSNVEPANIGGTRVPLVSYLQAGLWASPDERFHLNDCQFEYIYTDLFLSRNSFALKVKGRSMEPEFVEGDRIIMDPEVIPSPGDYVVAMHGDNEVTFKKYRVREVIDGEEVFELIPLNPDFPTLSSLHAPIAILGTMVEHRRYRRQR
ncbi:LexA family protein [Yokenella regensburgei]|uniref:LexA family protein n=1 Tax=Yokenella regensburgei TaxID=158877 RepID=UPI003ED9872A